METYDIDKGTKIALYGYNEYTIEQVNMLKANGYEAICIIDRRAKDIQTNLPISVVDEITQINEYKELAVWIMLQDAMQHYKIAESLFQKGIRKILFVPMKIGFYNDTVKYRMIFLYNYMFEKNYDELKKIPYISERFFGENTELFVTREKRFAEAQRGELMLAWIPITSLYTSTREPSKYADVPIIQFKPYCNLFDYLYGKNVDINEYIELFGIMHEDVNKEDKKEQIIAKRKRQLEYFEYEINKGMEYFIVSAPEARWNEKGYFNLCEGQHRCVFLYKKGLQKMPIRIRKDEYKRANGR